MKYEVTPKVIMTRSHFPDTRLEKEADVLVSNGFDCTLLVWDRGRMPNYCHNKLLKVKKFRLIAPPYSIRVAFYLPIWWLFLVYNLFIEKWDIVHAADFDTFLPALLCAKIKRKPIIYDIYDFYGDMIRFPIFPQIVRRILNYIDRKLIKYADLLILPDETRIEQIGEKYINNLIIINNSVPDSIVKENEGYINENNNSILKIFYGGSVTPDRGIEFLCNSVIGIEGVELIIMGPSTFTYAQKIRELCQGRENIKLNLNWVDYKEIIKNILKSDIIVAFYDPKIVNYKYASPNKLYESMICAKPIVSNIECAASELINKYEIGFTVPFGDVIKLKEVIKRLRDDITLRKKMGEKGRSIYYTKYAWEIMSEKLLKAYKSLLSKNVV